MRVLTIGTFDLFHFGHLRLLERAAQFGELHVGVNTDDFVQKYKGEPAQTQEVRLHVVSALACVAQTYFNRWDGRELIYKVHPDLLAIGTDWHNGVEADLEAKSRPYQDRYLAQINMTSKELFDDLGCGIVYLPRTLGISTTGLRGAEFYLRYPR